MASDFDPITRVGPLRPHRGDPCLIVVGTPARSELGRVLLLSRSLTLGRGTEADLALSDASMSRRHVQLTVDGQRVTLKDLGSRNGCFVNGNRASEVVLRDGDQLRLGATTLHFHASDATSLEPWSTNALEQAGVAHWEYDVTTGAVEWSAHADAALRLPKGTLPRSPVPFADLLHPDSRAEVAASLAAPGGAQVVECDARFVLGAHEPWVRLRGQVLRGEGGRPLRITGTAVDVTRAKQREQALARTAQVFEHVADAAVVTDGEGRVVALNERAAQAFGARLPAARGHDVFSVVGVREPEATRQVALDAVAKAGRWVAARNLKAGDDVHPYEVTAFALKDGAEPVGLAFLFRDVSEQRQLEVRLDQLDRLSSLGTLSAGIAHELNNPLSYVLANARVVFEKLHDHPDEEVRDALADLMEGSMRIASIVGDLRAFSRADAQLDTQPTNVAAVIESARKVTAKLVDARATFSVDVTGPVLVEAFEPRLVQVLVNLVINAAQAIPERASARGHIQVKVAPVDGGVAIDVIDDGEGMTAEVQRRVFDPFFTTRPVGFGAGLGLAVCHGVVTAMGGTLTVKSAPGEGSTFRVWLKKAQPRAAEAPTPVPFAVGERRLKVLLIDDEPLVLKALQRILKAHEVTTSNAVRAALQRIEAGEHFDVVVCDLMMPERTGIDLYEHLQAHSPELAGRVVFMTGGAFTERAERFLKEVPNRQLLKPVDATTLRQVVLEVADAAGVA